MRTVRTGPPFNPDQEVLVTIAGILESGILTWGVPLALLVVILTSWAVYARRHPEDF